MKFGQKPHKIEVRIREGGWDSFGDWKFVGIFDWPKKQDYLLHDLTPGIVLSYSVNVIDKSTGAVRSTWSGIREIPNTGEITFLRIFVHFPCQIYLIEFKVNWWLIYFSQTPIHTTKERRIDIRIRVREIDGVELSAVQVSAKGSWLEPSRAPDCVLFTET